MRDMLKILHMASFDGNIGDHANHSGFHKCIRNYIPYPVTITKLEIREFYYSWNMRKFDQDFVSYVNTFDSLVIGGGNFFDIRWDNSSNGTTIDLPISLLDKIKVPIIINGIGVDDDFGRAKKENIRKFGAFLEHLLLHKKCFFTVRNDGSKEIVEKYYGTNLADRITVIPDGAFFYEPKRFHHPELPENKTIIAINIAADLANVRYAEGKSETRLTKQESMQELVIALEHIMNANSEVHYVFVPHIYRDYEAILEVLSAMKDSESRTRCSVAPYVTGNVTDGDYIFDLYRKAQLTIGMRYHSNIGSIAVNTPTIGIINLEKHCNMYRDIGLDNRIVRSDSVGFGECLYNRIKYSVEHLGDLRKENEIILKVLKDRNDKVMKRLQHFLDNSE